MSELRDAVILLLDAGKIVLPDALDFLKRSTNPIEIAQSFLKINNDKRDVTSHDFSVLDSEPPARIVKNSPVRKGSVRRRISSNITPTLKVSTLDERITAKITPISVASEPIEIPVDKTENHIIRTSLDDLQGISNYEPQLIVLDNYDTIVNFGTSLDDLVGYFQDRFHKLSNIFRNRVDLVNIRTISDLKRTESEVSVIGMVTDKQFYPGKSGILTIEDPISETALQVIIPKSNPTLLEESLRIMNDTVICIVGYLKQEILIAKEILLPDIPTIRNRNRTDEAIHVAFLSDIHVGSKNFLNQPLERFIDFLNGRYGGKKLQALGLQTKYVMFSGDVVDGVGIYPNQISDLSIHSIRDQYTEFARFVERIPEDVQVVIIPGNHDMVRSAEPQPRIESEYAPDLDGFPNFHMLSNPSQVAVHGVQILLYHCTSMPDIINHIPGMDINKPHDVMKQMLKARHLAPIWGSKTPIVAESRDHLVIERIPDIFHGGHIHINGEGFYRGVQIVNSGTMQSQTSFQKSLNIDPTPGQISLINLKTFRWSRLVLL